MSTVDLNQEWVDSLEGPGLSLFVVSIVGGVVSLIVVGLRCFIRSRKGIFALDDGLMLGGLVLYLADVVLACIGAWRGLGTRNASLNPFLLMESMKYLMVWMLIYVAALATVKMAICATMLRIATTMPKTRMAVYALLALTIAAFMTTFIGILCLCRPVEANWDSSLLATGEGECSDISVMLGLSYTSTASTILTDLACAILPALILWQTQMQLKTKLMVIALLSFGSFASVCTMIRTPYIDNYNRPLDDLSYHISNIPLWSNVETAIGLIAGSLPAMRQLIAQHSPSKSAEGTAGSHGLYGSAGLVTIGGTGAATSSKARDRKGTKSNFTVNEAEDGEWTRLGDDGASDKGSDAPMRGIRKEMTYNVEMITSPDHRFKDRM